jgi:uncharacterized membrane protein
MPPTRPIPSPSDARDLRILYWCYIAMAVLTIVFGVWLYFQLEDLVQQAEQRMLGWQLVNPEDWAMLRGDPELDPLHTTLWLMQIFVIILTPVHALVYVIAAWYIHRLKDYWTLIIIAIFNTLAAPVGTIVSVYHLIVFFRPSVRELFGK